MTLPKGFKHVDPNTCGWCGKTGILPEDYAKHYNSHQKERDFVQNNRAAAKGWSDRSRAA